VGATFYYSNVVELFVSCGKGVVLSADPPTSPDPQIFHGGMYMVRGSSDGIYKSIAGSGPLQGTFVNLNQTVRVWWGITCAASGHVYASVNGTGIYKQTNGVGDFVFHSSQMFAGAMASAPNGDVYSIDQENGGYIWKSVNDGVFTSIPGTAKLWTNICAAPNGDIYIAETSPVSGGDIWKYSGGVLTALGQTIQHWSGLAADKYGNIYACKGIDGGAGGAGIYVRYSGIGDFIQINSLVRDWYAMAAAPTGEIYCGMFYAYPGIPTTDQGIYRKYGSGSFNVEDSTYGNIFSMAIKQF
jgi:hypothetical protein